MTRYARQIKVPGVGTAGQAKLAAAHVLVVGAGGLGSPVLQYLAGAGIGRITLVDPDLVEESNLHRQPIYRLSDLGRAKALAARDHLLMAHPDVEIIARVGSLHPAIADDMARPAHIVVDAADSYAVSYILSDACHRLKKPLISASALGQSGYVGGYCGGAPSLRAVFPDPPDNSATCASAGVMGPLVGMIGAMQAQIALQILLNHQPSPLGNLVTLDLKELRFGGFSFHDTPEPDCFASFVSTQDIVPTDQVIDLRGEDEAPFLLTPHAKRCLPECVNSIKISQNQRLVLCCATGLRAWWAASHFIEAGHANVRLVAARASA
ncbi:MAG: HesA/MoeB/ThiF family protein [Pseudomonadota bacterium]